MARPYSMDLRERAVAAAEAGASLRAVGRRFDVAPSSVAKWRKRKRETGSVAPRARSGRAPILSRYRDWLLDVLRRRPHTTLHALKDALRDAHGVEVSHDTVWRFLVGAGWSFKKNPRGRRAGPARRRPPAGRLGALPGQDRPATAGLRG